LGGGKRSPRKNHDIGVPLKREIFKKVVPGESNKKTWGV